jgi:hypothetical protein
VNLKDSPSTHYTFLNTQTRIEFELDFAPSVNIIEFDPELLPRRRKIPIAIRKGQWLREKNFSTLFFASFDIIDIIAHSYDLEN